VLDRLRRAASAAAFFTASPLTWPSAAWGFPWWPAPVPATFTRDIDAEKHRGPDRLVIFDGDDPAFTRAFSHTWGTLDDVVMARRPSPAAHRLCHFAAQVLRLCAVARAR